jgi:hypothetical protein
MQLTIEQAKQKYKEYIKKQSTITEDGDKKEEEEENSKIDQSEFDKFYDETVSNIKDTDGNENDRDVTKTSNAAEDATKEATNNIYGKSAERSEPSKDAYGSAIDRLIRSFNTLNDKTPFFLSKYQPSEDFYKSFCVCLSISDKLIYFDKELYEEGKAKLELNDLFYSELKTIAKEHGISSIRWEESEDAKYGIIEL